MPISCQRQTVSSGFGVWGFDSLETCTTFPREVHRFADHEEDTLMPGCPAVIDLWRHKEITFPSIVHSNADISSENTWTNVSGHTMCVEKDEKNDVSDSGTYSGVTGEPYGFYRGGSAGKFLYSAGVV